MKNKIIKVDKNDNTLFKLFTAIYNGFEIEIHNSNDENDNYILVYLLDKNNKKENEELFEIRKEDLNIHYYLNSDHKFDLYFFLKNYLFDDVKDYSRVLNDYSDVENLIIASKVLLTFEDEIYDLINKNLK